VEGRCVHHLSTVGLSPLYSFSPNETAQPLYGGVLPGNTTIGNGFASFLLGYYDNASIGNASDTQYRESRTLFTCRTRENHA